jgi:hypothetical protein
MKIKMLFTRWVSFYHVTEIYWKAGDVGTLIAEHFEHKLPTIKDNPFEILVNGRTFFVSGDAFLRIEE